jgi:hypothetical protein
MSTDWRRPRAGVKEQRPPIEPSVEPTVEHPAEPSVEPSVGPTAASTLDLAQPVEVDDLAAELEKRAPRGVPGRTTLVLAGAVLMVAGFLGGVLVQKNYGTTTSGSGNANALANAIAARQNGGNGFPGGTGGNGGTGGTGGAARNATTGTVKLVDGTTVYITTADGETVTVKTSGTTTVRTEQAGALADVPVGATVSIQGTTGTDGVVTATAVTVQK